MVSRECWTILSDRRSLSQFIAEARRDGWAHYSLLWEDQGVAMVTGMLVDEFARYPFLDGRRHLKRLGVTDPVLTRLVSAVGRGAVIGHRASPPTRRALA
jgi:hypothetical protein